MTEFFTSNFFISLISTIVSMGIGVYFGIDIQKHRSWRANSCIRHFVESATPVSEEIDSRGYTWSEARLDDALQITRELKP